ncbi:conserved membrane hypothetical protein [Burkholderiales bacterium 8X]|nr:conserved membrane hypothetical protein [Burkholderiales bacterium 8X]
MDIEASEPTASERHPIEFTASGSEYFRIWIVNLLLIAVTLGFYLPWAKARMIGYFCRNTWVAGDSLDFHGDPLKMLRGTLLAGALLAAYTFAGKFSQIAALAALAALVAIWPLLLRASLRFRLANTSWRGLRFRFTGDVAGAYGAILLPLALLLVPFALFGTLADDTPSGEDGILKIVLGALIGIGTVVFMFGFPYFLWRLKKYQHDHYVLGEIRTRMGGDLGVLYGLFIKTLGLAIATSLVIVAFVVAMFLTGNAGGRAVSVGRVVVVLVAFGAFNILIRNYLLVRLHNFWWSNTRAPELSFESRLSVRRFFLLQSKNMALIVLTLGLYWPFAVVAVRRAKLEALTVVTAVSLDRIHRVAGNEDPGATGEMAGELFDIDIGL